MSGCRQNWIFFGWLFSLILSHRTSGNGVPQDGEAPAARPHSPWLGGAIPGDPASKTLLQSDEAARCSTAAQPHAENQGPTRYLLLILSPCAPRIPSPAVWSSKDRSPASPGQSGFLGFPAYHSAVERCASVAERRALVEQANNSIDNLLDENQDCLTVQLGTPTSASSGSGRSRPEVAGSPGRHWPISGSCRRMKLDAS
jgi:hypothetical protein